MNGFALFSAAFLTGIMASLGLGGGMILIVYLTLFAGITQFTAQGINLIFFLPIAIASLIVHSKNKLVEWKKIIPAIISGVITAGIFSFAASAINENLLKKAFGIFLICTGAAQLLKKK